MKSNISDLTKDMRPNLRNLLIESIHDTIEIDKQKDSNNIDMVEYENNTFYYRAIYTFMQRAIIYYDSSDIENWSKKELLNEITLPEIESLSSFALKKINSLE